MADSDGGRNGNEPWRGKQIPWAVGLAVLAQFVTVVVFVVKMREDIDHLNTRNEAKDNAIARLDEFGSRRLAVVQDRQERALEVFYDVTGQLRDTATLALAVIQQGGCPALPQMPQMPRLQSAPPAEPQKDNEPQK